MGMLFSQQRLGQYEQPITIYKLRTMHAGAEQLFLNLIQARGAENGMKVRDDPRITPVGKILRRYFVDELPQLYNLARGELTLVGVRPRTAESWAQFPVTHKNAALAHKPGLMGVKYAENDVRDLQDVVELETAYLRRKSEDPLTTDREYFSRIVQNIVLGGARSQ